MKRLLTLGIIALFLSCDNEKKDDATIDYALLSGKIINSKGEKVKVLKGRETIKELTLNDDGTFADTLNIESGFYSLSHGGETSAIYLSPGDNVNVTLDTDMFDETITYTGEGSQNSNYLAAKFMANEKANIDFAKLYAQDETTFLAELDSIKNSKMELLKNQKDLNSDFAALEKKNIQYEYLSNINSYGPAHGYYTKKKGFTPSDSLMKPIKALDYTNEDDYSNVDAYKKLVQGHFFNKINELDNPSDIFLLIDKEAFPALKKDLSQMLSYKIAPNNEQNKEYYDGIIAMSKDKKFKDDLTTKYNTITKLAKGKPSPEFVDYENHNGGTTSLSDLNGKFVYIDVWATWCGPCIAEIPSLKKLEKQYHGKNIAFVSTSIDQERDHDKWVKMVTEKELGGIQLMADNDWKSKFVTDYAISGIPRFILIDPSGNIVNADAPRPSDPKLIELFDELKI